MPIVNEISFLDEDVRNAIKRYRNKDINSQKQSNTDRDAADPDMSFNTDQFLEHEILNRRNKFSFVFPPSRVKSIDSVK